MYGGRDEGVTLRCNNDMAGIIIDRFGSDIIMQPVDEGHFEAYINVAVSPLFLTWIMNFGKRVKIISPPGVIDEYIRTAKAAIKIYENDYE